MARDFARKSKILKSYCCLVAMLLYHTNASELLKVARARMITDRDDCKETRKNNRALHDNNEIDGRKTSK